MIDGQTLVTNAKCADFCIPPGMQLPVLIAIFARLSGSTLDPAVLLLRAKCIDTCIPRGMQVPALIALLAQIETGGGGGPAFGTPTLAYDHTTGPGIYHFTITQGDPATPTDSTYAWELQGSADGLAWADIIATQIIDGPGPDDIISPAFTGPPADGPFFRVRWVLLSNPSQGGNWSNIVQHP